VNIQFRAMKAIVTTEQSLSHVVTHRTCANTLKDILVKQIDTVIEPRKCKSNLSTVDTKHRTERQKRILVFAVVAVS